jgi:hypothetical protein
MGEGSADMHDTLASLVERALTGNQRPLEFYLRENGRLPGARVNLELANDVAYLLAAVVSQRRDAVKALISYFFASERKGSASNASAEFVTLCGIIASGACAAIEADWRADTFALLYDYADSSRLRMRAGVATAYQHLLNADPEETGRQLISLAREGSYFQQCVAIVTMDEPPLLYMPRVLATALQLPRIVLEHVLSAPQEARKRKDFYALRQALGYMLSVITVVAPEQGFALMRECATWNDPDITWILRENLKKKRLARFTEDTRTVASLLT